jgi:hypothetical protein
VTAGASRLKKCTLILALLQKLSLTPFPYPVRVEVVSEPDPVFASATDRAACRDCRTAAFSAWGPDAHAPTATPQRPDVNVFTPARERRTLVRNDLYVACKPATFARHRGSLARKQITLKRKVRSLGLRRSSTSLARFKPLRATPNPSRASQPALRARLRRLSMQGRRLRAQRFGGCARRSVRCTQGWGGSRSEVWGLRAGQRTLPVDGDSGCVAPKEVHSDPGSGMNFVGIPQGRRKLSANTRHEVI